MKIVNTSSEMELKINQMIDAENLKALREYKEEFKYIQSNYDMGMLTVAELMMQNLDVLLKYTNELTLIK